MRGDGINFHFIPRNERKFIHYIKKKSISVLYAVIVGLPVLRHLHEVCCVSVEMINKGRLFLPSLEKIQFILQ